MRAGRTLILVALLSILTGCACLPGGGKATNALETLKGSPSTQVSGDEIPSRRF